MSKKHANRAQTLQAKFDAAVEYACSVATEFFEQKQILENLKVPPEGEIDMELWARLGCTYTDCGDGSIIQITDEATADLYDLQFEDRHARQLMTQIVGGKLLFDRKLSDLEARFAGQLLLKHLPNLTKPRGRPPELDFERQRLLVILAQHLRVTFGLRLTRNTENRDRQGSASDSGLSASDAICAGFAKAGKSGIAFEAVKRVVSNRTLRNKVLRIEEMRSVGRLGR